MQRRWGRRRGGWSGARSGDDRGAPSPGTPSQGCRGVYVRNGHGERSRACAKCARQGCLIDGAGYDHGYTEYDWPGDAGSFPPVRDLGVGNMVAT